MLYAVDEHTVAEMVPQIPGQIAVDGSEQEAPARKTIKAYLEEALKDMIDDGRVVVMM